MKGCSMSSIIREMQIKTTMRYHLIPERMAIINKSTKQQVLARMWRKGNPFTLLVEMQTGATTVESNMGIPQKIKNGTALWHNDPTSGNISKESQNTNSKECMHAYVHCSVVYNHQDNEVAQMSISKLVDKKKIWDMYVMEILLSCKKKFYPLWQCWWT